MNRVHYNVSGMAGNESKTKIKNALDKIEGIQMVNVDIARGTVEVGFNAPANETQINTCIQHTGYTL